MKTKVKNLTKRQRHSIYKKALKLFTNPENSPTGLCWTIDSAFDFFKHKIDFMMYYSPRGDFKYFPEIAKHKPSKIRSDNFWWSVKNRTRRIAILEQAIEETKPDKKK